MLPHQARDYLGRYAFSGDDALKRVEVLSGGERARLALAKLALQDANFLLLDEPTNHLDIPAQEALQAVLENYSGTILLVTHDRYLVEALATQIWEIEPDEANLRIYRGRYSQMKEERSREHAPPVQLVRPPKRGKPRRDGEDPSSKEARRKAARMREVETSISMLERELARLSGKLERPPPDHAAAASLGLEYRRVQKQMDDLLAAWETLQD
jgi:ATP-binding cassette subfamily F protein 3